MYRKPASTAALRARLNGALAGVLFLAGLGLFVPASSVAQIRPPERQIRTYVPPDQLVSFLPSTPFDQFVAFLNPIFERVTGKTIVDPDQRTESIGISISGMYFRDAFELVLEQKNLLYKESEQYFVLEEAPAQSDVFVAGSALQQQTQQASGLVTAEAREVQIDALLFEVNVNRARELGVDWNVLFGEGSTSGGGTSGGNGSGTGSATQPRFFLRTASVFEGLDDVLLSPQVVDVSVLTRMLRLYETNGVGEAIANPQTRVLSGQTGKMQVGTDIPIQIRDFAGNTVTEFVQTGIIINVTPTVFLDAVADTANAPELEFVHLNVSVEKSGARPSAAGVSIDRNQANTQVLLLNGEQTIIGGLYSTEEQVNRRGIPVLKDLPGWFFGLRYLFGFEQKVKVQKELLIVLKARVVDPLYVRSQHRGPEDLRKQFEQQIRDRLQEFGTDPRKERPLLED